MRSRVGKSAEITWAEAIANERKIDRRYFWPSLAVTFALAVGTPVFGWPAWLNALGLGVVGLSFGRSMYWHGFHTGHTHGAAKGRRATRATYLWTDDGATAEQRAQADG